MEVLNPLYTLCRAIYDKVKVARANIPACVFLGQRATSIEAALKQLHAAGRVGPHNTRGLAALEATLQSAVEFLDEQSEKGALVRFLTAASVQSRLAELNTRITQCLVDLSIAHEAIKESDQAALLAAQRASHDAVVDAIAALQADTAAVGDRVVAELTAALQVSLRAQQDERGPGAGSAAPVGALRPAVAPVSERWRLDYGLVHFDCDVKRSGMHVRRRPLGGGSFGDVYAGTFLDARVAVKVLRCGFDAAALRTFRREITTVYALRHPNIVHVYGGTTHDEDDDEDDAEPTIVMELLEHNLAQVLKKQRAARTSTAGDDGTADATTPLTTERKLRISLDIVSALVYLHCRTPQIQHRDVKPANVMLDGTFRAKLIDFGLSLTKQSTLLRSRATTPVSTARSLATVQASVAGYTAWYAAPEVLTSADPSHASSDVYSLGLTLFELWAEVPCWGEHASAAAPTGDIVRGVRPDFATTVARGGVAVPDGIQQIVEQCWVGTASHRPLATDVYGALRRVAAGGVALPLPPVRQATELAGSPASPADLGSRTTTLAQVIAPVSSASGSTTGDGTVQHSRRSSVRSDASAASAPDAVPAPAQGLRASGTTAHNFSRSAPAIDAYGDYWEGDQGGRAPPLNPHLLMDDDDADGDVVATDEGHLDPDVDADADDVQEDLLSTVPHRFGQRPSQRRQHGRGRHGRRHLARRRESRDSGSASPPPGSPTTRGHRSVPSPEAAPPGRPPAPAGGRPVPPVVATRYDTAGPAPAFDPPSTAETRRRATSQRKQRRTSPNDVLR